MKKRSKIGVAYVPVLHNGYLSFFDHLTQEGIEALYLIADDLLVADDELDYIHRKDVLRALPHEVMVQLVQKVCGVPVHSLTKENVASVAETGATVLSPREDINKRLISEHFAENSVRYVDVFLRWNRDAVGEEHDADALELELSPFEQDLFTKIVDESSKSADWWRHVGAALVQNEKVIALSHNEHMPEEELPNILGDTRAMYKKGKNIHYVTSAHAEASVIGEAARKGIPTEGATLYVTDFPCPYCARLVVKSGITKVIYIRGYAVLGGDAFFKEMGVDVYRARLEEA
jgi:dCMP deaminase